MTTVLINGAFGKMGQIATQTINTHPDFTLVATLGRKDDLKKALEKHQPKLAIDFTLPECVFTNTQMFLNHKTHPIIGTSGLTPEQITQLQQQAQKTKTGGIIAPNFSIAANLMIHLSHIAAPFFQAAEIVERHHRQKVDAPAATAIKTALSIAQAQKEVQPPAIQSNYQVAGIPIHCQRLSGCIAEQEVFFAGQDERLTISYQCQHRRSFMAGLIFACTQAPKCTTLIYGLDKMILKTIQQD
jgi:4-hydroxy-tetrahydrodipicolinate reductase